LDVENSSSTICADWQRARGLPAVNSNSHHSGKCDPKIYFQNISGMRTKTQSVFMNTSNSDYNIIKLVETWLNTNFSSNEFIDPKLFQVFRKDRDFGRMQCERGGGVIVAVSRKFCRTLIHIIHHHSHEIIIIDDCFSMGLTQINNIFMICISFLI